MVLEEAVVVAVVAAVREAAVSQGFEGAEGEGGGAIPVAKGAVAGYPLGGGLAVVEAALDLAGGHGGGRVTTGGESRGGSEALGRSGRRGGGRDGCWGPFEGGGGRGGRG